MGLEWDSFVAMARAESWEDTINLAFEVLQRWVNNTDLFKVFARLSILEYVPFVTTSDPFVGHLTALSFY
jgi:DNA gyrase inhibitor GyrI